MNEDKTMTREMLLDALTESEKKLALCEEKLMSSENDNARYRDFLEDSELIGCFETDLKGRLTYSNRRNYEALGYDKATFMAEGPIYDSEEDSVRLRSALKSAKNNGRPAVVDYRLRHKNGAIRIVETEVSLIKDKAGNPVGYRGVSRDVTERRTLTKELQRYKDFVENVEDGCYEIDLKGYNTFCNQATERIMGYTREELTLINQKNFTRPEHLQEIRAIFSELYRTGDPPKPYLREVIRKDGEVRFVMASTSLIRDAKGNPVGFRGIIQDVTERKKLEEKEQKLTERLHQAQKMEAIGTLAGGIAHDFNNLLMGIMGYTSLMLLDTDPAHAHHERLKAIESIVRSGADLSKQLLGYARGGRYEVKPLNINEVIERTASMFGRTKKEIEIHQSLLPEIWSVEADQVQIEQVLMNLFVNAWQAMPGGGSLYLSSSNVILDEQYVKAFDAKPGPFVRISVTDTGVGMDEQVKARIFEPFFSTKGMGRGTGIGLASVYGIIRGHKGIIVVYSEKGRGANFNIYLPASEEVAVPLDVGPGVQSVQGHETILLAEDEVIIAEVTTQMLKSLGYEVLNASTGEEAAQVYRDNRARIDLVIMDMIMPGGGGGPAVDKISEINPDVKVILSSGYSLNGMIKDVMDRGGIRSFIQKPFLINELSAKIREILDRKN